MDNLILLYDNDFYFVYISLKLNFARSLQNLKMFHRGYYKIETDNEE
jgi:hypothetical protein